MHADRMITEIQRQAKEVTEDEMGDKETRLRPFELTIWTVGGLVFRGALFDLRAGRGYVVLDMMTDEQPQQVFIAIDHIIAVRPEWLE